MGNFEQLATFEASLTPDQPWPELAEECMPLFPTRLLPDRLGQLAEEMAACIPVPVDYVVCAMLGAASSALVGRVSIQPWDGYRERLQLYLCLGGESGTNKSGAMRVMMEPLKAWLTEHGLTILRRNEQRKTEREILNKQAQRKGMTDAIRTQLDKLADEPELPVILTDTTPDALPIRMKRQGGCGIIYTDEGNFINVIAGATYGRQDGVPNLDTVLKGFDGGRVHVDRVNRDTIMLETANLCITVGMQPSIIRRMTGNEELASRGFPQRVLYFLPDNLGRVDLLHLPPFPREGMDRWTSLLLELAQLHRDREAVLTMTPEAQQLLMLHRQAMHDRTDTDAAMRSWCRKAHGKSARLAGVLALLDNPGTLTVDACHVRAAVAMMESYFIPHAEKAFGGAPSMSPDALAMVDTLRRKGSLPRDRLWHDVQRQKKYRGADGKERFSSVLNELQGKGYIRLTIPPDTGGPGRKASPTVEVNPALLGQHPADIRMTEGTL